MTTMNQRFGPLTYGTLLGASLGLAVAAFGLYALREDIVQRSHESVVLVAVGAAVLGGCLGILAEHLIRHPRFANRKWIRHVIRPLAFCTVPYVLLAASMDFFGYAGLMRGIGFWLCVVVIPAIGVSLAWRRSDASAPSRVFAVPAESHVEKSLASCSSAADADAIVNFEDAAQAFHRRFLDGGIERCDFRPHFDGFLVNAWSAMLPVQNETATREAALALLAEMAAWVCVHADVFEAGDRLQLIIGFPDSVKRGSRQIFKCWLPASGLPSLKGVDFSAVGGGVHELEGWSDGVVWPSIEPRSHLPKPGPARTANGQSSAPQ